jgi:hypothetical protein
LKGNKVPGEIKRTKFVAEAEREDQQIVRLEAETLEQTRERVLLAAEFRKVASQLGELRRRETQLLRRVALVEIEKRQQEASLEVQSAETARLNAELAELRRHQRELDRALEAQGRQLELKRRQAGTRRTRLEELEARLQSLQADARRTKELEAQLQLLQADAQRTKELEAQLQSLQSEAPRIKETEAQLQFLLQVEAQRTKVLEAQLRLFKESTSWRLTRPLRWVSRRLPRFTPRLKHALKIFWETLSFKPVRYRIRRNRNARLIASSEFFDPDWYLGKYPDVRIANVDPVLHYLEQGASEGRDPSPLFDSSWYLQQNPDVRNAGINPLVHYLKHGATEGRYPGLWEETITRQRANGI